MGAADLDKSLNSLTVAEHTHINEMAANLRRKMQESQIQEGSSRTGGLRASILASVVAEGYESAREDLVDYVAVRTSYPGFQGRAERYVRHCSDLIQAIQTKRGFPGLAALSLSKQQEIHEKVLEHFEELKQNLKHIEKIERESRVTDVRSTVWVLKAFSIWTWILVAGAFLIDLKNGMLTAAFFAANHYLDTASSWFVNLVF